MVGCGLGSRNRGPVGHRGEVPDNAQDFRARALVFEFVALDDAGPCELGSRKYNNVV